jgi:hypothetical protein
MLITLITITMGDGAEAVKHIVSALLIAAGLINFLPVAGVLSAEVLAAAYGIQAPEGDLLILMRHRALLFGILGALIIVSAFRRHLQPAAILAGLVSMLGFVALALASGDFGAELRRVVIIDVIALVALAAAAFLRPKGAGSD